MTHVTVELFANNGYEVPIGPINIAVEELFPLILSTKRFPVGVADIDLADSVSNDQKLKILDLSVVVTIEYGRNLEKKVQKVTKQLVAALKQVLGEAVKFEVNFYFVKFTHASVVKSNAKKLPILEKDSILNDAIGRIFRRIIVEDPRLEEDVNTGSIRVLADLDRGLPPAASVLGEIDDESDDAETEPSGLTSLGAGEPIVADALPAPKPAVAMQG